MALAKRTRPRRRRTPERFRNARRSIVFANIPERLRDKRWRKMSGAPADFLVSIMVTLLGQTFAVL